MSPGGNLEDGSMQDTADNAPQAATSEVNLTPMLDVVFIMLIFFIVSASFLKEVGLDVTRSDRSSVIVSEAQSILVAIDQDSQIWIDRRIIDPRAVRAIIERLHAESPTAPVVVQADKRSSIKALVQVMNASREAGIFDVSLAAGER